MAGISERPNAFFRLSPAESGKAQCFAVNRGGITGRWDTAFNDPGLWKGLATQLPMLAVSELISASFSGGTPSTSEPDNWNGQIPWVSPKDFGEFEIADTIDHLSEAGIKAASLNLAETDSVLMVVRSGILRHTLPVAINTRPVAVNQDVKVFMLRPDCKPRYFAWYLWCFQKRILPLITKHSTTVQSVNTSEFSDLKIPLPSTVQQEKLIAAMEAARAERRAKLAEADALLAGLDDYLLATLGLTPPPKDERKIFGVQLCSLGKRVDPYSSQPRFRKLFAHIRASKYRVATFRELAIRIFSGVTPLAKGDAYVPPPEGVRFIRSGEITADGEVTPTSEVHLSATIHNGMMKRSQIESGDLLIAIVGATIGATGVFNRDEPANINQAIAAVRLTGDGISPEFACLYLRSSIGQALLDYFKRPVARANINLEEIGEIPLVIPPSDVQEKIVVESHRRRDEARRLRAEAEAGWEAAKRWFEEQLLGPMRT